MTLIDGLSVGTVAGIIAAGVFISKYSFVYLVRSPSNNIIVQFLVPIIVPLIVVGLLKQENNAATW